MVCLWRRHATERCVIWEIAQVLYLLCRESSGRVIFRVLTCFVVHGHGEDVLEDFFRADVRQGGESFLALGW